jgi:hypothetical protein
LAKAKRTGYGYSAMASKNAGHQGITRLGGQHGHFATILVR